MISIQINNKIFYLKSLMIKALIGQGIKIFIFMALHMASF